MAGRYFETFDVFTETVFAGNPLAVVFDGQDLTPDQMQTITREFNLSETTFILPPENPEHTARVRIFTLGYEMPFAGHPTVGTAIAIAKQRGLTGSLTLELNAGLFVVDVDASGSAMFARFSSPNMPGEIGPAPSSDALARALGLSVDDISDGAHRPRLCGSGGVNYVYVHSSLERVSAAQLNHGAFVDLDLDNTVGVYLYAHGGVHDSTHWHARMFAPTAGIPEDPATGSAAAGFPAQLLLAGEVHSPSHQWRVEQGYEMGRPSEIDLRIAQKEGVITSVEIGGFAVPVMHGELNH